MRITIEYERGNPRRYGRPWIAKVIAWNGKRPTLDWGVWNEGDSKTPSILEIEAEPCDIIRYGCKDHRAAPWKSDRRWAIVQPDGSLQGVSEAKAREHWLAGEGGV